MKVLIVEDDSILLKMYQTKFSVKGDVVEIASDGEAGLAKVKSFMPDVILMDIMMPKLDGLSALERIKADDATKHIPVIILTNLSTSQDADLAMKKGAATYIVKSDLTPLQVVEKTQEILSSMNKGNN